MDRHFRLLATDRGEGKTTNAFAWLSNGVKVSGYPGWSRVLVMPNRHIVQHHRKDYWTKLEDYDHRVYFLEEWADARGVNHDTEVCLDEMNLMFGQRFDFLPGRVTCATITARPWIPESFKKWSRRPTWMVS